MINDEGWFDWMSHVPGPVEKQYSQPNSVEMFIPHSAGGYYTGWQQRLFNMERDPVTGRFTPYAAASVQIWMNYDGSATQHYSVKTSCWASGSRTPNTRGVAVEFEGGPPGSEDEPLTEPQLRSLMMILFELAVYRGVSLSYWERPLSPIDEDATLYEHNECIRFGSGATLCPSNRIPWDEITKRLDAGSLDPIVAPPRHEDGLFPEPPYQVLYNEGVPVMRWGGGLPGRISKLFGQNYLWLRNDEGKAYWSDEEGD